MTAAAAGVPEAVRPDLQRVRACLAERVGDEAGRTWRDIAPAVRTALVMLALDVVGDARDFARRPWGSYSPDEQVQLGAIAREFRRQLAGAEALR